MAESKRRGKDAVDEQLDDLLNGADEDNALDDDDALDDDGDGKTTATSRRSSRRGKGADQDGAAKPPKGGTPRTRNDDDRPGIFGRISRFIREIVAELRKVIWPTRKELLTYTAVVIVFVTIMLSIVGGLDVLFAWVVLHVFGGKAK